MEAPLPLYGGGQSAAPSNVKHVVIELKAQVLYLMIDLYEKHAWFIQMLIIYYLFYNKSMYKCVIYRIKRYNSSIYNYSSHIKNKLMMRIIKANLPLSPFLVMP